jgi:hypothetical protein
MGVLRKFVGILSLLLFIASAVLAQDFKVRLDSSKILIGNQTALTLQVKLTDGKKVRFPNLPDTLSKGLEVVSQFAADTSEVDGGLLLTKRYLITSFDSGSYVVPRIPVLFFNGAKVDTLYTQPLKLRVNTVAVDSTKVPLYGIKGNIKAPYTFQEIALAILSILLLIGIVIGIYRYFRRSKDEPIFTFRKKVIEPPHVIAFRELEQLKQKKLWQSGQVKEYYSELTDILRVYIEERMDINAMEMTSFEILAALNANGYSNKAIFDRLMAMLNTSDLVKFAKYSADPIENDSASACVYDFIDDTKEITLAVETTSSNEAKVQSSTENN